MEIAYFEPFHDSHGEASDADVHASHHEVVRDEAPLGMVIPLLIVACGILVLGFFAGTIIENVVAFAVPEGF